MSLKHKGIHKYYRIMVPLKGVFECLHLRCVQPLQTYIIHSFSAFSQECRFLFIVFFYIKFAHFFFLLINQFCKCWNSIFSTRTGFHSKACWQIMFLIYTCVKFSIVRINRKKMFYSFCTCNFINTNILECSIWN